MKKTCMMFSFREEIGNANREMDEGMPVGASLAKKRLTTLFQFNFLGVFNARAVQFLPSSPRP
jgi:hypothetical protein